MKGDQAEGSKILGEKDLSNKIQRLAAQITERQPARLPCFVGIHTRGVTVARRVLSALGDSGSNVALGTLDISFYRDDLDHRRANPVVQASEIPFEVEGAEPLIIRMGVWGDAAPQGEGLVGAKTPHKSRRVVWGEGTATPGLKIPS